MPDFMLNNNIISSAEKTLELIELLAEAGGSLTVSEMARRLNMHVSSVSRYLRTFQSKGYVIKDSQTGMFALNEAFISLANTLVENHPLTKMYLDTMHTLAYKYAATTHIMAFRNHQCITLHKDLRIPNMGYNKAFFDKTRYFYCSAPGKMLLSTYTDKDLDEYLDNTRIIIFTNHTLSSKAAIKEEIRKVRELGYSLHDEEWLTGNLTISFPLTVNGKTCGAMSLMCDIERKEEMLSPATIADIKLMCKEPGTR